MTEKVALITGGSRGIGRAIALQLSRDGYRVVVNYRQELAAAQQVIEEIRQFGGDVFALQADVSIPEQAQALIDESVRTLGRLDVLVNNAGISQNQLLIRLSDQDWNRMMDTNLGSSFHCCRAALKPMMKQRFGRIINISSVVGMAGNVGQAHYAASKAGLIGLTRSIAREYGNRGITANVLAPGYIDTDMTREMSGENREKILEGIAVGRLGTPQDIAGVVSFLVSPGADYITGQVIRVDGGMSSL